MDFSSVFEYRDGVLYWKVDRRSNKVKGKPAGAIASDGRLKVGVGGKGRKSTRLNSSH